MAKPTRAYLKTDEGKFRPLLWVLNNKPNEMLLGLFGLSSKTSTLRSAWPEQIVGKADLPSVRYRFDNAVDIGLEFDHVTCHADGRFHLKTRGNENIYTHAMQRAQPLGANTSTFLEVIVMSDIGARYQV